MNKKDNLLVIDPKLLNIDDGSSLSSNGSNPITRENVKKMNYKDNGLSSMLNLLSILLSLLVPILLLSNNNVFEFLSVKNKDSIYIIYQIQIFK